MTIWKRFWQNWPFMKRIHRSQVDFSHKGSAEKCFDISFVVKLGSCDVTLMRPVWFKIMTSRENFHSQRRLSYGRLFQMAVSRQRKNYAYKFITAANTGVIMLRPRQHCRHLEDGKVQCKFLHENCVFWFDFHWNFFPLFHLTIIHHCFRHYLKCNRREGIININTLEPRQNGRRFADDTFKRLFLNENDRISIKISLKFVPKGPINNNPALVQIMAWRRSGDKILSELMMVNSQTHMCLITSKDIPHRTNFQVHFLHIVFRSNFTDPINNKSVSVQIMAWYQTSNKPLIEPIMPVHWRTYPSPDLLSDLISWLYIHKWL